MTRRRLVHVGNTDALSTRVAFKTTMAGKLSAEVLLLAAHVYNNLQTQAERRVCEIGDTPGEKLKRSGNRFGAERCAELRRSRTGRRLNARWSHRQKNFTPPSHHADTSLLHRHRRLLSVTPSQSGAGAGAGAEHTHTHTPFGIHTSSIEGRDGIKAV